MSNHPVNQNFNDAVKWTQTYYNQSTNPPKDPGISWLWIILIIVLLAFAIWWWIVNNKVKTPSSNTRKDSLDDLKLGAAQTNGKARFIVRPDGTVIAE